LAGLVSSGVGRQSPGTDASTRPRGRLSWCIMANSSRFHVLFAWERNKNAELHPEGGPAPGRRPCTRKAALHPEGGPAPGRRPCTRKSALHPEGGPAAMNEQAGNLVLGVAGERIERIKSERLALCLREALEGQHRHVVGGAAVRVLVELRDEGVNAFVQVATADQPDRGRHVNEAPSRVPALQ